MQTITGTIQAYAWGSTDGIAAVLGTEPTGEPQAEYWLGAHPKAPSGLADGTRLDAHLASRPELIGATSLDRFGPRLPFLLKIISAAQALSLQAHPSRSQAIDGFRRENAEGIPLDAPHRNYRDDWPKPELVVALTQFDGLCGFRDPAETQALAARLGVPDLDQLLEPLAEADGIARVFLEILGIAQLEDDLVPAVVARAEPQAGEDSDFGRFCETVVSLNADYPGDPGVLAAMLMNRLRLQPGQAFFMPAGNLHAYLQGTGLEVMSNSDNVLRGGLTPKHIDVDELAQVVDFMPGVPPLISPTQVTPGVLRYPTPAPEFALYQVQEATDQPLPASGSARILLVVDGTAVLVSDTDELAVGRGGAAFVGADEDIRIDCPGRAFVAAAGS